MKVIVLAATCCLGAVVSLTAHAASGSGAPPCTPKQGKLNGRPIMFECGPATATLHTGGKTYTYRNGQCRRSTSAGMILELDLGTLAYTTKGNAGKPYFSLADVKVAATVNAYNGGKLIANGLAAVSGHIPGTGRFKSKFGPHFSGSWNCHGVVWQAP